MIDVIVLIFVCFAIAYLLLIGIFTIGWFRLKTVLNPCSHVDIEVSILIPVRNEERNIRDIFQDIISQDYKRSNMEIIFIDDNSDDNTYVILKSLIAKHPKNKFTLLQTSTHLQGKKNAIEKAVGVSRGDLILTTDGDCRLESSWASSMAGFYKDTKPCFISGPVVFHPVSSMFEMFQAIEFSSLAGSGAGSVKSGIPVMCNGANLAFEKDAFLKVGGYSGNKNFASGDDIFLMQKIKKAFGGNSISFLKNQDAIVKTRPKGSFCEFYDQRKRWVSKSGGYNDFWLILTSLTVYLFNLSILLSLIFSFFVPGYLIVFLSLVIVKLIADLPLLAGISSFYGQQRYLSFYPLFQILYIPYVVFIGMAGNMFSFKWKKV